MTSVTEVPHGDIGVVALVSGVLSAIRASRLDPIEAPHE